MAGFLFSQLDVIRSYDVIILCMNEQTIAGLPLTTDVDLVVDPALEKLVSEQKAELLHLGCTPTAVHVSGAGVPPRFFISFQPDKPSFEVRGRLEANKYDIGQQMGDKMLRFYASKRVAKGDGWTT
jgi:hypothetical protein